MNYRREFLHSLAMVVTGIGGYSAYVQSVKPAVRPDATFRTGTVGRCMSLTHIVVNRSSYLNVGYLILFTHVLSFVDDQIMDELRTGDVVLFDRSWVKRHVRNAKQAFMI
jgi:hypothetical protein